LAATGGGGFFARLTAVSYASSAADDTGTWKWIEVGLSGTPTATWGDLGSESTDYTAMSFISTASGSKYPVAAHPYIGMRVLMFQSKDSGFQEFIPIDSTTQLGTLTTKSGTKWKWVPTSLNGTSGAETANYNAVEVTGTASQTWADGAASGDKVMLFQLPGLDSSHVVQWSFLSLFPAVGDGGGAASRGGLLTNVYQTIDGAKDFKALTYHRDGLKTYNPEDYCSFVDSPGMTWVNTTAGYTGVTGIVRDIYGFFSSSVLRFSTPTNRGVGVDLGFGEGYNLVGTFVRAGHFQTIDGSTSKVLKGKTFTFLDQGGNTIKVNGGIIVEDDPYPILYPCG